MATFNIHKGINKPVEFKGLVSQYLFIFAGGLLALFIILIVMYMAGVGQWFCLGFGIITGSLLVIVTFKLNNKYHTYGLMKLAASKRRPLRIINRKNIQRLIRH